ncbi:GNAT family N-acetyltransferase [Weissella diestrammenae]|uniref:GNAT family N-acetyltransferase n=1 Tax=Weissella diestrammenae TaxID=1162633 RepID=A0A7G9T5M8_9LACO|nr:GNAT family N-acetyltransferase [Weissella diestrammenae]MCM0582229.1 GNAT family N-acetyltransferase [Weissella diestrammenae]QNN75403.1 GNAT family N-acetyltransferase [Weissella diestrammenae]
MVLQTERMILRNFKLSDALAVFEYAKNPKVGPIAGWPVHKSVAESRDNIENYFMSPHIFAMTLKENVDHVIGLIGLELVDDGNGKSFMKPGEAEISYWIGESYWGQGLTPEAIEAVVRYGFETLNLSKIWCGYKDGNQQSKRAQEKQGFTYQLTMENMYNPYLNEVIVEHFTARTARRGDE